MELRLRLRAAGGARRDLYVEIDGERSVADLTQALAARLQVEGGEVALGLHSRRQRAWLRPEHAVGEARLRQGDELLLGPLDSGVPESAATGPMITLLVQGGPCAGLRIPLGPGHHQIGRSSECDVVIDDPAVSRVHALLEVGGEGRVTVSDAGSSNTIYHEGQRLTGPAVLRAGQEIELGRTLLTFLPHGEGHAPPPDAAGRILFNRPPRLLRKGPALKFELEAPPQQSRSAAFSITSAVLPLGMGLVMYAVTRQAVSLLMGLLSPLMVVGAWLEQRVGGSRRYRQGVERYRQRLLQLNQEMGRAVRAEAHHRRAIAPGLADLALRAQAVTSRLWERRPDNPDFLLMRAGWSDQPSGLEVAMGSGGDATVRSETADLTQPYATLRAMPLTVSLTEAGSLGIAGERPHVLGMARSLLLQTAVLHSPEEVMIAAALPVRDRGAWRWLGWLPHVRPEAPPLAGPAMAEGRVASRDLLERLLRLVDERRGQSHSSYGSGAAQRVPAVLVLLDGDADLPRAGVDRLLGDGPGCGVYAIWLGRSAQTLPGACGAVLELDAETAKPRLVLPGAATSQEAFASDLASLPLAEEMALSLAPVRDVEAADQQAEIPRYVSLLDLLGLQNDSVQRVVEHWGEDDGRLTARLGMAAGAAPCEISLRADGPHALAGGMTGAGKSELLQTLVASLAAAHAPRRMTFILVDYKGGAAFKDCVDLPHTVGFVTDLDGHLVNRALISLRAELRRREEVLRRAGCKDLVDFEQQDPEQAFPSLAIIVDEFATLVTELPDFVDGMVDVAQRGRSLGIHMVLATQRPAGVINDRIRANTNLRLSLRFSDAAESQDVIGTADAARPGLPRGRAFVRSGPGSLAEFQAAHASGRTPAQGGRSPILVRDLDVTGEIVEEPGQARSRAMGPTDLQRVVEAVREAASLTGVVAPARPWLPVLPEAIPLAELGEREPVPAGRPAAQIGLLDEPARQRQRVCLFDMEADGGVLVYGTSGTGKTTFLRTLAVSLAGILPPDQLHIYALDFATRGLRPLAALPHCGSVIAGDEPERAQRLLTMLRAELERRKTLFAATGASTLSEYHAGGGKRLPWELILLDGYSGFRSTFEEIDMGAPLDAFRSLVSEGRPLGMAFAISADRSGAVPTPLTATVTRRIVLRMANDDEYSYLGLARSAYEGASMPPGRGFTEQELEIQCAIPGEHPAGGAQAAAIEDLGAELASRYPEAAVPAVRLLPAEVPRASLPAPDRPLQALIGLQDGDLIPARVDLSEGHVLVAGPRRSGRTTTLAAFATSLHRGPGAAPLFLLAPRRQSSLPELAFWKEAAVGLDACADLARRLAAAVAGESTEIDLSRGAVILLDDGEHLVDLPGSSELESIAQRGGDLNVRLVTAIETQAAHRAFGGWVAQVQRDRHGFLLDPDSALDGALVGGVRLPLRRGPMPPGRGYLVRAGIVTLVQVAGE